MAPPRSNIDWKRRFTLPVALPLNEGDLPTGDFDIYFTNAGITASRVEYPDPVFAPAAPREFRQAGTASVFLLPRSSRAKVDGNVTPVSIDEGKVRAALRTTQYQGDLPDDIQAAVELESQRIHVVFEDYRSELPPLPLVPQKAIRVTWPLEQNPPQPALINTTFAGVAPQVNGAVTLPASPAYLLHTSATIPGELDPYLVRAPFAGLARFQRYFHLKKSGTDLQGRNPSNSGRLVVWDPDPAHLADNGTDENRVTRTITAVAFEGIDAGYQFTSADIGLTMDASKLARKPAIAEAYKQLLTFYLSHYAGIRAAQADSSLATPQTGLPPLLFGLMSNTLTRLLRCWVAYSGFILQPAWAPTFPDAAFLTALQGSNPVPEATIEAIAAFLKTDVAHWKRLMDFIDCIFAPFYLGATWRSLGVPTSRMPTTTAAAGWWRANRWAWEVLSGLGLYNHNWLAVYAGCPLSRPSGFYKAAQIENPAAADDEERLKQGEGLGVHELEALALAGAAQTALGAANPPALPASLTLPVDLDQFQANQIGYALTMRTYRVEVAPNAAVQTVQVATTGWLADLLVGIDGGRPLLELGVTFQNHPFVDPSLVQVSQAFTIRSLRADGNQASLARNDVIEYRVVLGSIIGDTPATQGLVQLKIMLKATDGTSQDYLHFRAPAVAADAAYQLSPALSVQTSTLLSGWTVDEAVELFLALHPLDYERYLLLVHDNDHTETSVCAWNLAVPRADGKVDLQEVSYRLISGGQEIGSGVAAGKLSLSAAAPPAQIYPPLFQQKVETGAGLPPNTNLTSDTGSIPADTLTSQRAFLNEQLVTQPEHGLALLNSYTARTGSDARRTAIDTAWRAGVTTAGDLRNNALGRARTGYESIFFKLLEAELTPAFARGITPEFVKSTFHQRIRIVHRAYTDYSAYLASRGLPTLQVPVEAMWALYRIEGVLNVPPSFEMLQRGIPPIQRAPQKIIVFPRPIDLGGGVIDISELMIGDLIARDESQLVAAGAVHAGTSLFASISSGAAKPAIDRARQWCLPLYHINLLAMDIYVDPSHFPFNERNSRYAFVKTYVMTRKALGLALSEDLAREALAAWYRMVGLLVSCRKGVAFVAVREAVEMASFWLLEAMLHFTMMRRRAAITGRVLAHDLPLRLAYLRFNFGEVSFWRIVNIIVTRAHSNIGALPIAAFPPAIRAFLERVRDDLETDLTPPALSRLKAMADLTGQLSGDLTRRQQDTRANVATFQAVEDRLLRRDTPTAGELAALDAVLPGANESALLADVNTQTGGRFGEIDALISWLDAKNLWEGLDGFFATRELDDLLIAFINRADSAGWRLNNLFLYEQARRYGHYVSGFNQIFA